jgi:hypothetical protein
LKDLSAHLWARRLWAWLWARSSCFHDLSAFSVQFIFANLLHVVPRHAIIFRCLPRHAIFHYLVVRRHRLGGRIALRRAG